MLDIVKVLVFNRQEDLPLATRSVGPIVKAVLALENRTTDEVAIHFVKQDEICALHDQFFHDPSPTDCISFPLDETYDSPYHILGEVFVCPKTAIDYVRSKKNENILPEDQYEETTLYVVHGLLHLLGYDDVEVGDRRKMRQMEKKMMQHLTASNLRLFP